MLLILLFSLRISIRFFVCSQNRRANNIAIVLRRFAISVADLVDCIQELDLSILLPDRTTSLLTALPTPEETRLISGYKGAVSNLGIAEQFVFLLSRLSDPRARLETAVYMGVFAEQRRDVLEGCGAIVRACEQAMQRSPLLLRAIQVCHGVSVSVVTAAVAAAVF